MGYKAGIHTRFPFWLTVVLSCILALTGFPGAALADTQVPKAETPNYKVAFYASPNYHIQDESGARSGYGYEMMQSINNHMQATFSYVGYDKTPDECVDMLRNGEVDLYTAARLTEERSAEFVFSKHPAITSTTAMNVKVSNTSVVAGDYSTYNGLRVGLLSRHTYNGKVLDFFKQNNITCEIVYYETPTELSNALVNDEVDALVNSYIRTPEDERMVQDFGQTPYYFMALPQNQALIDQIDSAIDSMNIETPNWRVDLYNLYYGQADKNCDFTDAEQQLLNTLQTSGTVVRAVVNPESRPYSWYENGEAKGIAVDLFKETANRLGLSYEFIPISSVGEYQEAVSSGAVDVWADMGGTFDNEVLTKYRLTDPYLSTTLSVVRERGSSGKLETLATPDYNISVKETIAKTWPDVQVSSAQDADGCIGMVSSGQADGALLKTYVAQQTIKSNLTNGMQAEIVPGVTLDMRMGVNVEDNRDFYGVWEKTLYQVAQENSAEVVQSYLEETETPSIGAYFFNHPILLVTMVTLLLLVLFLFLLFVLSNRAKRRQQQVSRQLAAALAEAHDANDAKQNFFSKMSHDIRTPLNAVLGMTQVAKKYQDDPAKLSGTLDSIASEGNYLLALVNSILDVNQLEHGHIELSHEPFSLAECVSEAVDMLRPLAEKNGLVIETKYPSDPCAVVGDEGHYGQIVINIVSNAIKYTEKGGFVRVELESLPGSVYRFTCTDNGIGMDESFVNHITEDYVRAEDSRVSKTQGTGLGMSVVKGFTELMGGTLQVESKVGFGSTFIIDIPFQPASKEQCADLAARKAEHEDGMPKFADTTVLLVEDNALNAEIATELFDSLGIDVAWAEDGARAVEMVANAKPREYAAVFMDMQMPVMDGIEATKAIRSAGHANSNVPIIAMTANIFESDRKRCEEAGMDDYVSKPVDVEAIVAVLKRVREERS